MKQSATESNGRHSPRGSLPDGRRAGDFCLSRSRISLAHAMTWRSQVKFHYGIDSGYFSANIWAVPIPIINPTFERRRSWPSPGCSASRGRSRTSVTAGQPSRPPGALTGAPAAGAAAPASGPSATTRASKCPAPFQKNGAFFMYFGCPAEPFHF